MADDLIPGMAEAIEARRRLLNLSVGELAAIAGITPQALSGYRKGERRDSPAADRTKRGLAIALQWPGDWYERLDAGEDASTFQSPTWAEDRLRGLREERARIEAEIAELTGKTFGGGRFSPPDDADPEGSA